MSFSLYILTSQVTMYTFTFFDGHVCYREWNEQKEKEQNTIDIQHIVSFLQVNDPEDNERDTGENAKGNSDVSW